MARFTSHAPGTFSWIDLATSDQDAAKTFYASLMGWENIDVAIGDSVCYSTAWRKSVGKTSPRSLPCPKRRQRWASLRIGRAM